MLCDSQSDRYNAFDSWYSCGNPDAVVVAVPPGADADADVKGTSSCNRWNPLGDDMPKFTDCINSKTCAVGTRGARLVPWSGSLIVLSLSVYHIASSWSGTFVASRICFANHRMSSALPV